MLYFYGDDIPDAENTQGWWWETSKKVEVKKRKGRKENER